VGRSVSTTVLAVIVAAVVAASVAGGVSYYISSHRPAATTTVYKTATRASSTGTSSITPTATATTTATTTYNATNSSTSCAVSISTYLVNYQQIEVPAGSTYEYTFPIRYPGSIEVIIFNSSTYDTYVEISGVAVNGTSYSSGQVIVGESGNMWYNVLPGTVHVYIGNGNSTSEANVTLTIYYSNNC
jgi:cytoskeletal protein RodZ